MKHPHNFIFTVPSGLYTACFFLKSPQNREANSSPKIFCKDNLCCAIDSMFFLDIDTS